MTRSLLKRPPADRDPSSGFTLLETLIAVLLLTTILTAGSSAITTLFNAKRLAETQMDRLSALERTSAFLRQDIGAARPRVWEAARSGSQPRSMFGGRPNAERTYLGLVRSGWLNPGFEDERSDLLAVEYRFRDGELRRHVIMRPDPTRTTPVQSETLLTGIKDIEVTFRKGAVFSAQWDLTTEEGRAVLPDTVRVFFEFETGETLEQIFLVGGR